MATYLVNYGYTHEHLPKMEALSGKLSVPAGITILAKYAVCGQRRGLLIVECASHDMLAAALKEWRTFLTFEVLPLTALK